MNYSERSERWASLAYLTMFAGHVPLYLVGLIFGFDDSMGVNGVLSLGLLLVGLMFGCLGGFSKPPQSIWRDRTLEYWVWGALLFLRAWFAFLFIFVPWATATVGGCVGVPW